MINHLRFNLSSVNVTMDEINIQNNWTQLFLSKLEKYHQDIQTKSNLTNEYNNIYQNWTQLLTDLEKNQYKQMWSNSVWFLIILGIIITIFCLIKLVSFKQSLLGIIGIAIGIQINFLSFSI